MDEIINELVAAANLLRTVKVDGEYWYIMAAVYGTLVQTAQKLQKGGISSNESSNNGADA